MYRSQQNFKTVKKMGAHNQSSEIQVIDRWLV